LIELLVVIAILAAMLLPALASAKKEGDDGRRYVQFALGESWAGHVS